MGLEQCADLIMRPRLLYVSGCTRYMHSHFEDAIRILQSEILSWESKYIDRIGHLENVSERKCCS